MVQSQSFALLTIAGLVASTCVYKLAQASGSDDPFAIELVAWWMFTDAILSSKLRGWELKCSSTFIKQYGDAMVSGLLWLGIIALLATTVLSLTRSDGSQNNIYRVLPTSTDQGAVISLVRTVLARSLAGGYSSLHLLVFLG